MEQKKRVLVVDDEETLCEALKFYLEAEEGYAVDVAHSAEEALTLNLADYAIFVLDIMMGDISGTQLARILRTTPATVGIPIIFCTARDSEDDMIEGLDLGADDYITKPFSLKVAAAKIRTVLRRAGGRTENCTDRVEYKGLVIIPPKKQCIVDGEEVRLPRKEFEILLKLLSGRGQIFSREELLREIWPEEVIVLDRVVDVNITRIRHKIGPYGKNIRTRSGYGYGFMD